MGGFNDELVGGLGNLARAFMRSPNYVPGLQGWALFKNGDIDVNSGSFRGTVIIGTPGSDVVITDVIPPELMAFYVTSGVFSDLSTAVIQISPGDGSYTYFIAGDNNVVPFTAWAIGIVTTTGQVIQQLNGSYFPTTGVSQLDLGNTDDDFRVVTQGFMNLLGSQSEAPATFNDAIHANGNVTVDSTLSGADLLLANGAALIGDARADIEMNGVSLGLGTIYFQPITTSAASSAVAGTETLMHTTTNTMTLGPGRAARGRVLAVCTTAVAQNFLWHIRKTNLAGTALGTAVGRTEIKTINSNTPFIAECIFINSTAAAVTFKLALTATPAIATLVNILGAAGAGDCYWEVQDIGSTAIYSGVSV